MANKIKVHVIDNVKSQVTLKKQYLRESNLRDGESWAMLFDVVDTEGSIEVWLDLDKLAANYNHVAFENKNRRFIRGPIEVRATNIKEGQKRKLRKGYIPGKPTQLEEVES